MIKRDKSNRVRFIISERGRVVNWRDYARYARQSADELARDCEVQVFRAKGPGGQGVNTTDSAVRMTHVPTGITVTARETRSQFQNRQLCLQKLSHVMKRRAQPPRVRKKTKVSKAARERRLADKHHRSQLKRQRGRAGDEW